MSVMRFCSGPLEKCSGWSGLSILEGAVCEYAVRLQ